VRKLELFVRAQGRGNEKVSEGGTVVGTIDDCRDHFLWNAGRMALQAKAKEQ
jgi:hypothetical protein